MATWADDIVEALRNLDYEAHLEEIFHEASLIRDAPLPKNVDATVRGAIERHSSDSRKYDGGPDYFYSVHGKGQGVWGLRKVYR